MKYPVNEKEVSTEYLEKILKDFYCENETCHGWETNVITQPETVKNIVEVGASRIAAGMGVGNHIEDRNIASKIDHTLLKPEATPSDIRALCEEARKFGFASVCVNPSYVSLCTKLLEGSEVKVCTVIGFPLGSTTTEVKKFEAEQAINSGAQELDMVIHIGMLKHGSYDYVQNEIRVLADLAHSRKALLKVILETALLTDEEKVKACLICKKSGADFVKTSTGFSKGGATVGDVALMKYVVGAGIGVKASGGIRSREDAEKMVSSGADRIGASASVRILLGEKGESQY